MTKLQFGTLGEGAQASRQARRGREARRGGAVMSRKSIAIATIIDRAKDLDAEALQIVAAATAVLATMRGTRDWTQVESALVSRVAERPRLLDRLVRVLPAMRAGRHLKERIAKL